MINKEVKEEYEEEEGVERGRRSRSEERIYTAIIE
jgi:hypothetical protein